MATKEWTRKIMSRFGNFSIRLGSLKDWRIQTLPMDTEKIKAVIHIGPAKPFVFLYTVITIVT